MLLDIRTRIRTVFDPFVAPLRLAGAMRGADVRDETSRLLDEEARIIQGAIEGSQVYGSVYTAPYIRLRI